MKLLYIPNEYSQQRQHEKKANIYPVLMAMEAEYNRKKGHNVTWDENLYYDFDKFDKIITKPEGLSFLDLPAPDRVWTRAKEYTSGNYKYLPGTHIMAASGCWHGKCKFCVEKGIKYEARPVDNVIEEIKECKALGFKEVFDDSGTFPVGQWLSKFCTKLVPISSGLKFSCNMRMVDVDYSLMYRAGFRMVLFGLESANQKTLDKINKGVNKDAYKYVIQASKAGLEPHIAGMIGYPWETLEDTMRTIDLFKYLLIKGYAKTAQMSFYTPPKFQQQGNEEFRKYVNKFYEVGFNLEFWYNKIKDINSLTDLDYLRRSINIGLKGLLKRRK